MTEPLLLLVAGFGVLCMIVMFAGGIYESSRHS